MSNPLKAHADIAGLAYPAMCQMMLHEAEEHGLPVLEQGADHLQIGSVYGAFGITRRSEGLRLKVEAPDPAAMFEMRDALVAHIQHYLPEIAATIRWSDAPVPGGLPPNFQFAQVLDSQPLCANFHRVTLQLDRWDSFDDSAIHFRLVLPDADDPYPHWPSMGQNGSTVWPKGDKALHRPVYTAHQIDGLGRMTVDVFHHAGGRAIGWALAARPGNRAALIGPGGGGVPEARALVLSGDETAYPAIARILAATAQDVPIRVVLMSHGGARDYPFPSHPGAEMTWLAPGDDLVAAALRAVDDLQTPFVWLGAEKAVAQRMRAVAGDRGWARSQMYIAAYWARS